MDNVNDRIRKFIIKDTLEDFPYSPEDGLFHVTLRAVQSGDRERYRKEISRYAGWRNQTAENIDKFVRDARTAASLNSQRRTASTPNLMLSTLVRGTIVDLYEGDKNVGDMLRLRLLYLGSDTGSHRFMVIMSNRTALQPEDIVEAYNVDLWSEGHPAVFKVWRNGVRIPEGTNRVYVTLPLQQIVIEQPSIIHDVIDSRHDFTYDEYAAEKNSSGAITLSYRNPPIALLMHDYSTLMPAYADFDDSGITCTLTVSKDVADDIPVRMRYNNDSKKLNAINEQ